VVGSRALLKKEIFAMPICIGSNCLLVLAENISTANIRVSNTNAEFFFRCLGVHGKTAHTAKLYSRAVCDYVHSDPRISVHGRSMSTVIRYQDVVRVAWLQTTETGME
jgi:hypothetical protein